MKRELIENSHKKRTYVLRVLFVAILMLIMLVFYSQEFARRRTTVLAALGRGFELAGVLLVVDLCAVYILLPALACSAISTEREKQTLPLLLISRIRPGALVLEKFLSRLFPMIVLLLITMPMLGICYVFGGVTPGIIVSALAIVLTASIQVASTAILCSTLFRTTLEAFWATYGILAFMAVVPALMDEYDLLPQIQLIGEVPHGEQGVLFVVFLASVELVMRGQVEFRSLFLSTLPPLIVSGLMLAISGFVLSRFKETSPFSARGLAKWFRQAPSFFLNLMLSPFRSARRIFRRLDVSPVSDRPIRAYPRDRPIAWREIASSMLAGWRCQAVLCVLILLGEWWVVEEAHRVYQRTDFCVFIDIVVLILGLLFVMGVTCRTFASERERQTLDLLLTTPTDNRALLKEKLAAANKTQWLMLISIGLAGICHILLCEFRVPTHGAAGGYLRHSATEVLPFSWEWCWGNTRFLLGLLTHSFVYMMILKWTAVYFSLRLNSLMKCMLATLISITTLCIVPFLCFMLPMLLANLNPDDLPGLFFMTPIAVLIVNEYSELQIFYANSAWPDSEYSILITNAVIYSGLALGLRAFVYRKLSRLLNRRD